MTWLDEQPADKVAKGLDIYQRLGRPMASYAGDDDRFGWWLKLTDLAVQKRIGLGLFDLADWTLRDLYDDGASPLTAALETIAHDDTFGSLA
jgi:hypothetical protein